MLPPMLMFLPVRKALSSLDRYPVIQIADMDQLCRLALPSEDAMKVLHADHQLLLEAILLGNTVLADQTLKEHLSRLTPTVEANYTTHRTSIDD